METSYSIALFWVHNYNFSWMRSKSALDSASSEHCQVCCLVPFSIPFLPLRQRWSPWTWTICVVSPTFNPCGSSLFPSPWPNEGSRHTELDWIEQGPKIGVFSVIAKCFGQKARAMPANTCLCREVPCLSQSLIWISLLSDTYLFFSTAVLPLRESRWHQRWRLRTALHTVPMVLILKKKVKGQSQQYCKFKNILHGSGETKPHVLCLYSLSGDTSILMVSDNSCRPLTISYLFSYSNFSHHTWLS